MSTSIQSNKSSFIALSKEAPITEAFFIRFISNVLSRITRGHLTISYKGETFSFGEELHKSSLQAHIQIHNNDFFKKLFLHSSIGAAESYMDKDWSTPDLTKVIQLMAMNLKVINQMDQKRPWLSRLSHKLFHFFNRNSISGSKENISAHYDLSNDLFQLFLDSTMMYSSAIFESPKSTLEEASIHKLKTICEKLELTPDDHLLEIGTGWGYMAIYAAKHYGCKVTTTTLSKEQYQFAQSRIEQEGLSDKITLLLKDYRDLEGQYDKLVSIEMIEAVGHEYFDTYFSKCSSLLKEDGAMLIQAITISDQRYDEAISSVDFIQRYIFPGGCLPCSSAISDSIKRKTNLQLHDFQNMGQDYARTLELWRENFFHKIDEVKALGFDDKFIRMWEYYLCYCEGGFLENSISAAQFMFTKEQWKSQR